MNLFICLFDVIEDLVDIRGDTYRSKTMASFIMAAKRTAFGGFGGSLKELTPTILATEAAKGAIAASGIAADAIDSSVHPFMP